MSKNHFEILFSQLFLIHKRNNEKKEANPEYMF